jgi:hypothetical protein
VNKRANKIVKIVDGPTQMSRRRSRSRFAPPLGLPIDFQLHPTAGNAGEGEMGSPVARGRRVLPGSDGASPYHPQASLHPLVEAAHP